MRPQRPIGDPLMAAIEAAKDAAPSQPSGRPLLSDPEVEKIARAAIAAYLDALRNAYT